LLSKISFLFCKGGIAQLGERLHGMQEVSGSIPLTSTIRAERSLVRCLDLVAKKTSQAVTM
jgi:hypothetical protein